MATSMVNNDDMNAMPMLKKPRFALPQRALQWRNTLLEDSRSPFC
jgi:hypothetical protein